MLKKFGQKVVVKNLTSLLYKIGKKVAVKYLTSLLHSDNSNSPLLFFLNILTHFPKKLQLLMHSLTKFNMVQLLVLPSLKN